MLGGGGRSAGAVADAPTVVHALTQVALDEIARSHPKVAIRLHLAGAAPVASSARCGRCVASQRALTARQPGAVPGFTPQPSARRRCCCRQPRCRGTPAGRGSRARGHGHPPIRLRAPERQRTTAQAAVPRSHRRRHPAPDIRSSAGRSFRGAGVLPDRRAAGPAAFTPSPASPRAGPCAAGPREAGTAPCWRLPRRLRCIRPGSGAATVPAGSRVPIQAASKSPMSPMSPMPAMRTFMESACSARRLRRLHD